MNVKHVVWGALPLAAALLVSPTAAEASSHREAPFITQMPKVDATDLYMFRSYEPGRGDFVTIIADYVPVQDPYAGPNYYALDPEALYEIHIDNNGDASEDVTFQFRFDKDLANNGDGVALMVGESGSQKSVAIPLKNFGVITATDKSKLNVQEFYEVTMVKGDRRTGMGQKLTRSGSQDTRFEKPIDYIGTKSIPDYAAYAQAHVYEIDVPGCTPPSGQKAKLFVGQRKDPFVVNLGQTFDLFNYADPLGNPSQGLDDLDGKNITTFALELPISCVTADANSPIIGGWTTASVRQGRVIDPTPTFERPAREGGPWAQVSRLGNPLVNEVVIGLPDKNRFNSSEPSGDTQFIDYVTHPTLPELIETVFGASTAPAPNVFPRSDLVAVFLTGVEGVNQPMNVTPGEMMRLNTALPATPAANQNNLGAAGCFVRPSGGGARELMVMGNAACDPAGFPNGRRPGDDVVDIALRVAMGYLLALDQAPAADATFTDGAAVSAADFDTSFPYLKTPIAGSAAP